MLHQKLSVLEKVRRDLDLLADATGPMPDEVKDNCVFLGLKKVKNQQFLQVSQ